MSNSTKIQILEFIDEMKTIQELILDFIDKEESSEMDQNFQDVIKIIQEKKIREDKYKLFETLRLISKISQNHYRSLNFFEKIDKIISILTNDINKHFTNAEIFHLFKKNKQILFLLFSKQILVPDQMIADTFQTEYYKERFYPDYFYPEFSNFYDICQTKSRNKDIYSDIQSFNEKRMKGENDNYICYLIQRDSIEDFVSFVIKSSISLNSNIHPSIFETNAFLLNQKSTSLIEYASFFGSFQIFQFLRINKVTLTPSLWRYTVHGNNPELIHILEEDKIEREDKSYAAFLFESIKCHHINIMNYLLDEFDIKNERINIQGIKYSNFICILNNDYLDNKSILISFFANLCKYEHYFIVNLVLENTDLDINKKDVFKYKNKFI